LVKHLLFFSNSSDQEFTQEKKIMKYGRCFLLILALNHVTIHSFQDEINPWENAFEHLSEDPFILETTMDEDEGMNFNTTRAIITPQQVIENLTDPGGHIQAQTILQNPLYYRSNPPMRRNIIDNPIFQQFVERGNSGQNFSFKPFITQTFKEYFYDTRSNINYYIDMNQNDANNQLNDLLTQIDTIDFLPRGFTTVSNVLGLFNTIYLEERRVGAMFEYVKSTETWTLSGRFPFYYGEHNLNMPQEDQLKVQKNPFFGNSDFDEVTFAREHLISDQIGFGDLRINFEHLFIDTHKQIFSAGIRATIPTAFAIKKGLYGTNFDVFTPAPTFNLYTDLLLPALSTPPDQNIPLVQQNVQALGDAIINRLATILVQTPLGNNHHLGIGVFTHNEMIFSERLSLSGLLSAEILLPANEQRFFITYTPAAAFNSFNWVDSSVQVNEKLNFLNQQFINKFFPTRYEVSVFPGFIIQSTSAFTYRGRRADLTAGTDMWWHTNERFLTIDAPEQIKTQNVIKKSTAKMGYGYQSMLWFALEKKFKPGSSWKFGLRAEVTTNSFEVGEEWGACILIQKFF
jgi:hypothetical protein